MMIYIPKEKELGPSRVYLNHEKLLNFQKSINMKVSEQDAADSFLSVKCN